MLVAALRFTNVFGAAVAAGGMLLILIAITPVRTAMAPAAAASFHFEMSRRIDWFMPATVGATLVSATVLLLLDRPPGTAAFGCTVLGLLCSAVVAGLSAAILLPVNRRVGRWHSARPVAELHDLFRRWGRLNHIRVGSAVIALCADLIAALAS
jgi:uncharacterized membrane protein